MKMGALGLVILCVFLVSHCYGSPTPFVYDTIIVGLGASGSAAAAVLAQANKKLLALEAQGRIGGRVYTAPFGDGIVELGAEWIHGSESSSTYELAIKNNVTILAQNSSINVYFSDGTLNKGSVIFRDIAKFALEVVDNPPQEPEPLGQYVSRRVRDYIKVNHPTIANDTDLIEGVLEVLDQLINTDYSANDWNDVSTNTSYRKRKGYQYLSWHKYGYKTLFEILLNTYNNGPGYPTLEIKLNTEVTRIQWPQDPKNNVLVTVKDGSTYTAKNVIVTVSVGVLQERYKSLFSPPLSEQKISSLKAISIGVCGKMIFRFEHAWWPRDSLGFFIWRGVDKASLSEDDKWLLRVNAPSSPMSSKTSLSFWACGQTAKTMESLPEEVVRTKVMSLIRRFMGAGRTIPEPIELLRSSWYSNPFTRGSYTYDNLDTPKHPTARADLAAPLCDSAGTPRVLFAGEATDTYHFSTVHGAVDTGRREANRILSAAN